MSSHFDEKSGVICCSTPWGQWYQTAEEVVIEIFSSTEVRGTSYAVCKFSFPRIQNHRTHGIGLTLKVKRTHWSTEFFLTNTLCLMYTSFETGRCGKDVVVNITPSLISCSIKGDEVLNGKLFDNVIADESTWSVEDRKLIRILLAKALRKQAPCWRSLLINEVYSPDEWTYDQMQRKLTLERYQVEHPGFDFSSAEISGNYVSGGHLN